MDDLERMEMSETGCDLAQCTFRIKCDRDIPEVIRALDNVGEGCGAEFDRNIKEIRLGFLIEVPDDVGMVVRFLEDADFTGSQGDEVLEEAFDRDSTAL